MKNTLRLLIGLAIASYSCAGSHVTCPTYTRDIQSPTIHSTVKTRNNTQKVFASVEQENKPNEDLMYIFQ